MSSIAEVVERVRRERLGEAARLIAQSAVSSSSRWTGGGSPFPVAGPAVRVRREPARGDVDERLHDVRPPRGREVGARCGAQRWVEELEQRHLRVDGGDSGTAATMRSPPVQHHHAHLPAGRIDSATGAEQRSSPPDRGEAADGARVGERLCAASGVPLPEPVVRGLPEHEQRTAGGGGADARVRGEHGDRSTGEVGHKLSPEH